MTLGHISSQPLSGFGHRDLFIDGRWVPGGGARIDVIDPSTGQIITSVANATVEDGIAAVDACADAAADWAATAPRKRSDILMRAYELMKSRSDELAHLIALENGKALADAKGEVSYAAEFFRWYAEEAVRMHGQISIAPGGQNRIIVQHQPIGIAVLITPWNFPAAMATRKIGPALAAGCTCILKPARETPLTAIAIAQILDEAGVPSGVVNVITTSKSSEVMGRILADPRVRKLSFTGSTEIGRHLLRDAADRILKCSMELGGNAPFLVLDDADLDQAIDGAMVAKMRNGGQACTAANRFYVQSGIYDEFARQLTDRMKQIKLGPGCSPQTQCGPLVSQAARDGVESLVQDAMDGGARTLTGGERCEGDGFFYPPTVLVDVSPDARILREEIFGPVAVLLKFEDVDEAITLANRTEYGLVSYVYTRDLAKGLKISEQLEAGMIALNRGLVSDPAAPFGGVKESGLGREGAHVGLLEYTETKYIAVEW